jgi:predicted TIM-barrel fold metal-dependent hydrolase
MPGGNGIKLKYGQPIPYIDDIAADFPDLNIIMAHPAVPWQEEQLSVLVHKPNVYMDLSGWSPKYFRPILVQYMNSIVQDKVLFGTDYPVIMLDRWESDFATLDLKPEVRQKIMLDNAKKLLKL